MILQAGARLGPYEILAPLGAGGMGEVYKARDTRLDRIVAIKVAQEQFSERFEREAQAVAALNHPHICTLHDVGPNYLVMEYFEGSPLTGPLPLDQVLKYAAQICDAIDAAHRKGIVHRDLKPANILLTRSGGPAAPPVVKLLDFGLAKRAEPRGSGTVDGTRTVPALTGAHTILGTPQYMAPEQIEGGDADARTDIFAFGCVLYELLTGQKAFDGKTASSVMAAILATEPRSVRELQPVTPPILERVVTRCLAKDPEHRWQSARDLKLELEWIASGGAKNTSVTVAKPRRLWPWIAVTGLFALAIAAAWLLKPVPSPPDPPLLEMAIAPPEGVRFLEAGAGARVRSVVGYGALSPDGRYLLVSGTLRDQQEMLWLHDLSSNTAAVPLKGTEGAAGPFWSPDSKWVAFFADGRLLKVSIAGGGPPIPICKAVAGAGTWNQAGLILFSQRLLPIQQVSAGGGRSSGALEFDSTLGEKSQGAPRFLPDGQRFLYSSTGNDVGNVMLASLDGKTHRRLFTNPNSPASYAANPAGGGYLLYVSQQGQLSQLFARTFDADKGLAGSEEVPLADTHATGPVFSTSSNGLLAFERLRPVTRQLTWFGEGGLQLDTVAEPGDVGTPRISPDGKTIAYVRVDRQNQNVWLFDVIRGVATQMTSGPERTVSPVWTGIGSLIYVGGKGLFEQLRDGQRRAFEHTPSGMIALGGFPPDGSLLPVTETGGGYGRVFLISRKGGQPFASALETASQGSISPDGRWLLYRQRPPDGLVEVFVRRIPKDERSPWADARQISVAGGDRPIWSVDGRQLFYVAADGQMTSVPVESGDGDVFRKGRPRPLFPTRLLESSRTMPDYDVDRNGRFLIAQPVAGPDVPRISVIVNWPKMLEKR